MSYIFLTFNFVDNMEVVILKLLEFKNIMEQHFSLKVFAENKIPTSDLVEKVYKFCLLYSGVTFYPYQEQFSKRIIRSLLENDGAEITALFARQCIPEGSVIHTRDGKLVKIEEHPNSWKTQENADILEVRVEGGYVIRATKNHPIMTNMGWLPVGMLKEGDLIAVLDKWEKFGEGRVDSIYIDNSLIELLVKVLNNQYVDSYILQENGFNSLYDFKKFMRFNEEGFPEAVSDFTKEQVIMFFRKIFNQLTFVEGSVSLIQCENRVFAEFFRELLNKLGVVSGIYEYGKKFDVVVEDENSLNLLSNILYNTNFEVRNEYAFTDIDGEVFKYRRIISIKYAGKADVYDVEYPEKGWFIYGGVKVHNSGKTETVATTVGGLMILLPKLANMPMFANDKRLEMFRDGLWVGIFAPSLNQAQITYNRIRTRLTSKNAQAVFEDSDFNLSFNTFNGQTVSLNNGSFATAVSASDGSNIEGGTYKLIVLEECQDISDFKILKSIHPMGAAYNSTIVKIGTAVPYIGDFYHAIQRNKIAYERGEIRIRNHFEYDCDVVSKYNEKYAKYLTKERIRLGENSDEYLMSYKLKWIIERGMFVDISKFEKNNCDRTISFVPYDLEKIHVVGIDLGGKNDKTVISVVEVDWSQPVVYEKVLKDNMEEEVFVAYATKLKNLKEIQNVDYNEQYYEILDFLKNYNIARIVIDATRESSVAHRLAANLPIEVIPFVFSEKSKSEMYKHFDKEIKSGRFKVPADDYTRETREYKTFMSELSQLQKNYRGQFMLVSHPNERNAHDDYPDSVALAVFGAREPVDSAGIIETMNYNPFLQYKGFRNTYKSINKLTARRR